MAYIVPRSLIACKFRKNQNLIDEKGGMEAAKGEITVSDMFKLYKYENLLYTMELSGLEIKDYLEFS